MPKISYFIINTITWYRLLAAAVLLVLIVTGHYILFAWLLPVSFFTDLIDGFLARKYKVTSTKGAKLDSVSDDATVLVAIIGLFVFKYDFVVQNKVLIFAGLTLYAIQTLVALIRYKKISSFHTYLAKAAALFQGFFFISTFLLPEPVYWLFYPAAFITIIQLLEEIILVLLMPRWQANVKGIYWVLKRNKQA